MTADRNDKAKWNAFPKCYAFNRNCPNYSHDMVH
jgi:hypothetical protein